MTLSTEQKIKITQEIEEKVAEIWCNIVDDCKDNNKEIPADKLSSLSSDFGEILKGLSEGYGIAGVRG